MIDEFFSAWLHLLGGTPCYRIHGKGRREKTWRTISVYATQRRNEFGPERNAIFFLPGEYNVDVPIGFYTQVLGLGAAPDRVHITGNVHSDAASRNNNATTTFWRARSTCF